MGEGRISPYSTTKFNTLTTFSTIEVCRKFLQNIRMGVDLNTIQKRKVLQKVEAISLAWFSCGPDLNKNMYMYVDLINLLNLISTGSGWENHLCQAQM